MAGRGSENIHFTRKSISTNTEQKVKSNSVKLVGIILSEGKHEQKHLGYTQLIFFMITFKKCISMNISLALPPRLLP